MASSYNFSGKYWLSNGKRLDDIIWKSFSYPTLNDIITICGFVFDPVKIAGGSRFRYHFDSNYRKRDILLTFWFFNRYSNLYIPFKDCWYLVLFDELIIFWFEQNWLYGLQIQKTGKLHWVLLLRKRFHIAEKLEAWLLLGCEESLRNQNTSHIIWWAIIDGPCVQMKRLETNWTV